jgi:thioredoxin-like negative regulator of GroEL
LVEPEDSPSTPHANIEHIDDSNWEEFFDSSLAVLVLSRSSCPHCKKWIEQLIAFLEEDEAWGHVRFGKIDLEGPEVSRFKESNEWLDHVEYLPFTIIINAGTPVSSFPGAGISRMVKRLERMKGADTNSEEAG